MREIIKYKMLRYYRTVLEQESTRGYLFKRIGRRKIKVTK
jgi:hypothetical protein